MDQQTIGTVTAAKKQWWLKINTKAGRTHPLDGAAFPYIIKVTYSVDGKEYAKRKWINPGQPVPKVGGQVQVLYDTEKPGRAKIL